MDCTSLSFSIIVPVFNEEGSIVDVIGHIKNVWRDCDYPYEIIVVDDGSTDETGAIVQSYNEKVRCIHQSNAGVSAARNRGIQAARGEWIAFLDADDEWLPHFVESQLRLRATISLGVDCMIMSLDTLQPLGALTGSSRCFTRL